MSARIEVSSESGVVTLGDATVALPAGLEQDILLRQLEPRARSAQVFFLMTDDPVKYRIEVLANEPLPSGLDREFESLGGAFRLEAPNERVALIGWDKSGQPREAGSVSVNPGAYLLSVFGRRPFDGKRHAEDMAKLLGADAKFMQTGRPTRVDWLPSDDPGRDQSFRCPMAMALVPGAGARRVLAALPGCEAQPAVPERRGPCRQR